MEITESTRVNVNKKSLLCQNEPTATPKTLIKTVKVMEALRAKIENFKAQIDDSEDKHEDNQKKIKEANEKYHSFLSEIDSLKRKCAMTNREIEKTKKLNEDIEEKCIRLEKIALDNNAKINDLRDKEDNIDDILTETKEKLSAEKNKHMSMSSQFQSLRSRKMLLTGQIERQTKFNEEKERLQDKLTCELSQQKVKLEALDVSLEEDEDPAGKVEDLEQKIKSEQARQREAQQKVFELEHECDATKEAIENIIKKREEVNDEMKTLAKDLTDG